MSTDLRETLHNALQSNPRTRDPVNALVVWSELGKGLSGTLDRKGANPGLLRRLIEDWSTSAGSPEVDLRDWVYQVPPAQRLSQETLAQILRDVQQRLEHAVLPVLEASGDDGGKAAFIAVAKAWFATGMDLLRALPAGRHASAAERSGAMRAWCARFLPRDESGPEELGVRMVKQ